MAKKYVGQPVIPEIAKAYQDDPRTKLAANALAAGSSTAPVAGGDWAVADGIARVIQGIMGGVMDKKSRKQYRADEEELRLARQGYGTPGTTPGYGDPVDPTVRAAAQVLAPPVEPPALAPQSAPQPVAAIAAPPGPAPLQPSPTAPMEAAMGIPPQEATVPAAGQRQPMQQGVVFADPFSLTAGRTAANDVRGSIPYSELIRVEGGTARDGSFRRSPKGAWGPAQLMPGTAPEAMALAGYSRNDQRWKTDAKINAQAGEAYYNMLRKKYGDDSLAAAAYNAGPGRIDKVLRHAERKGIDWRTSPFLPQETKNYVANVGRGAPQEAPTEVVKPSSISVDVPPPPPEVALPNAPEAVPATQSDRLALARRMLQVGNRYDSDRAMKMLDTGMGEQTELNERYAGRKQDIADTGYKAGLDRYGQSQDARTQAGWQARQAAVNQNYAIGAREDTQSHELTREQRREAFELRKAGIDHQNARELAKLNNDADWRRTVATIEAAKATKEEKEAALQDNFVQKPVGARALRERDEVLTAVDKRDELIDEFVGLNAKAGTGGPLSALAGDGTSWLQSTEWQRMRTITNLLATDLNKDLKGSTSDGDLKMLQAATLSIKNGRSANSQTAEMFKRAHARARERSMYAFEAQARGTAAVIDFSRQWDQYRNSVSIKDPNAPSFEQWRAAPTRKAL